MNAESSYNPFSGFAPQNNQQQSNRNNGALGSKLQAVDWEKTKLVPGQWNVMEAQAILAAAAAKAAHATHVANKVTPLTPEESEAWRKEHNITVFASSCPAPIPKFSMLAGLIPPSILTKFTEQGFTEPTGIQAQSWPILFGHRDIVGIAKTGSGKTLSFVIPAITHIMQQPPLQYGDGPIALILAPTRELAQQIETETRKVLPTNLGIVCLFGGSPKGPQIQQLRSLPHFVVATPGRLIDMLEIKKITLLRVTYLVLDEADRMLDMGFEPQVRSVCSQIRPDRQTLMFSATWPKEIQTLAGTFQRDFIRIHVGSTELLANPDVTQRFIQTTDYGKFDELKKIMATYRGRRVLVFCKTKRTADQLEYQLKGLGFDAMAIHGDKEQAQRNYILERFRRDSQLCLVATDVAARGLDIKQLEVVVNYDFPMQIDDYVHRIGRTGRAGAKGDSITFLTTKEDQINGAAMRQLIQLITSSKQEVPPFILEWSERLCNVVRRGGYSRFGSRAGPSLHYSHTNRPSFDPRSAAGGYGSHAAPAQQWFGLPPPSGEGSAAPSFQGQTRSYTKFEDDDHSHKRPREE